MKKAISLLLACATVLALLTGCATTPDASESGTSTTAADTTTTQATTTTAEETDMTTSTTDSTSTSATTEPQASGTASTMAAPTTTTKKVTTATKASTTTKKTTTTKAPTTTLAPITPTTPYKVALSDNRLHYEGRTMIENNSVLLDWTGTGVTMQVQGGDVRVKLTSDHSPSSGLVPCFGVYINGKRKKTVFATSFTEWHTVASGLPTNRYTTVSIVKLSEAMYSSATLFDIELTGILGPKPTLSDRKMLILGDSVTCGWGTKTESASEGFTTPTEDGSLTYPWLLADRFSAQKHILAVSGNGLATSNQGLTNANLLPQQLPFVHYEADYSGPQWDHSQYQPDLILVNLGTNDVFAGSPADRLANGVKSFSATLRQTYPNATIVWVYGLMTAAQEETIRVAAEEVAETDSKVHYLYVDTVYGNELGSGTHPNERGHKRAANELEPQIREIMGW